MTETIIITAGGIGKRMGSEIPKQFIEVKGLPILMHTINKFISYSKRIQIILVLPKAHLKFWDTLVKKHQFTVKHITVEGGKERFFSIKNGLAKATGNLIGVHDGVRPFVSIDVIKNAFNMSKKHQGVVPVVDLKESIRQVKDIHSRGVNRSQFKIAQTPQCFQSDVIKTAYLQDFSDKYTDDASVVESVFYNIHLIKGNEENIKITTPLDLKLANILCNK